MGSTPQTLPGTSGGMPEQSYAQMFGSNPALAQAFNYNLANNPSFAPLAQQGAAPQPVGPGAPPMPSGPSAWASPWQQRQYSQGIANGQQGVGNGQPPWGGFGGNPGSGGWAIPQPGAGGSPPWMQSPPYGPQQQAPQQVGGVPGGVAGLSGMGGSGSGYSGNMSAPQGAGAIYAQGYGGHARGGVARRDAGGEVPWYERAEARSIGSPGGLVNSAVPGRTDQLPMTVAGHSYVVPADIVSGLGQGNTMAGAKILDSLLKTGPYNSAYQPGGHRGNTIPTPYHMPLQPWQAVGGVVGHHGGGTPVVVAGGEYVVPPEVVLRLGGGNMRKGHEILDRMVKKVRPQIVAHTKKLPGPRK